MQHSDNQCNDNPLIHPQHRIMQFIISNINYHKKGRDKLRTGQSVAYEYFKNKKTNNLVSNTYGYDIKNKKQVSRKHNLAFILKLRLIKHINYGKSCLNLIINLLKKSFLFILNRKKGKKFKDSGRFLYCPSPATTSQNEKRCTEYWCTFTNKSQLGFFFKEHGLEKGFFNTDTHIHRRQKQRVQFSWSFLSFCSCRLKKLLKIIE